MTRRRNLTPAAEKWLEAAVRAHPAPVHPTAGPYRQLRAAGLVEAPQHAMTLNPSRVAELQAWALRRAEAAR